METKWRQIERRNMEEKWKAHPTRANIFIDQDKWSLKKLYIF